MLEQRVAERTRQLTAVNDDLRRSEAYLAQAQRVSHTGSFGWSVSSGDIVWSDETFRILEYDRTIQPTVELVFQRMHPEDRALVQQIIDRRFYRQKYDATRTLAVFSAALRNEVDLEQLSEQLIAVVEETMRPTHVSLWLREPYRYERLREGVYE